MSEYSRYEAAVKSAEGKGCVVVAPGPRELFLDIDDAQSLAVFDRNVERLREVLPMTWSKRPSPSGADGRYHIVVTLERDLVGVQERILLQALLGSDLTREVLSYQRAVRGDDVPTLFFERKGGAYDPSHDVAMKPSEIDELLG